MLGDFHVFIEGQFGAVEHVGTEEVGQALSAAAGGFGNQRTQEGVHLLGLAVVGVQGNLDGILLRHQVQVLGEGNRAERPVLDRLPGSKLAPARGDLDDAVALRLGKGAQGGVGGGHGRDVDGRVGKAVLLGVVQHFAVGFVICNGHGGSRLLGLSNSEILPRIPHTNKPISCPVKWTLGECLQLW